MKSWTRKLRMGMVGGGQGAFIGGVHRIAAAIDQQIELVAGCFSRDPKNTRQTGHELYLNPGRCYDSFQEMARAEAALNADRRIDFVSIATPNVGHLAVAKAVESSAGGATWVNLLRRPGPQPNARRIWGMLWPRLVEGLRSKVKVGRRIFAPATFNLQPSLPAAWSGIEIPRFAWQVPD